MSEVDLSNGYVRIANRLLEVIYSANFNATQLKILLMIMRYTYGFNRKSHSLSITFISNGTGISRRSERKKIVKLPQNQSKSRLSPFKISLLCYYSTRE